MSDRLHDPWTLVGAALAGVMAIGLLGDWNAWAAFLWTIALGGAAVVQRYSSWASMGARQAIGLGAAGVWLFGTIWLLVTRVWPGIVVGVGAAGMLWAMWGAPGVRRVGEDG